MHHQHLHTLNEIYDSAKCIQKTHRSAHIPSHAAEDATQCRSTKADWEQACILAAAAGAHMAKHGNRAVSRYCGAADVLEACKYGESRAAVNVKFDAAYCMESPKI